MIGKLLLTASAALLFSFPVLAQDVTPVHGLAMHGAPKYAADFQHLDYVNPDAPKGGTLRLSELTTFDSLNGYIIKGVAAAGLGYIHETLLTPSLDEPFTEYGLIAETVEVPEDRSWVIFNLRPQAKWHDGKAITAEDVVWSFNTLVTEGAPSFKAYYHNVKSAEVLSPAKVKFTFDMAGNMELPLIVGQMPILPKHFYTDGTHKFSESSLTPPLGSGPYKIGKVAPGRSIEYDRVTDWWGKDDPAAVGVYNFAELRFPIVLDEKLLLEKAKKGEVDIYSVNRSSWWKDEFDPAKNDNVKRGLLQRRKIYNFDPKGTMGFALNSREEPFNDIKVRQAIANLWNVDQLIEKLFFNEYERVSSYFQGSVCANPNDKLMPYNPTQAVKLLTEAGWAKKAGEPWLSKNGKIFEIDLAIFDPSQERIYTPFQDDLKKVGIKLNLVQLTPQAGFQKVMDHQFKIHSQNWTGTIFPQPDDIFSSKSADKKETANITGLKNKEIDALADAYEKEYNPAKRIALCQKMDSIAVLQNQYAFGWVAPYTFRGVFWNKFEMPKTGFAYGGDHLSNIFAYWWYNADKDAKLKEAMADKSKKLPVGTLDVDAYGRKSKK